VDTLTERQPMRACGTPRLATDSARSERSSRVASPVFRYFDSPHRIIWFSGAVATSDSTSGWV